jgi:flagellar biosynthesis protein FlhA
MIVTRMSGSQDMGQQMILQLFSQRRSLAVTAGIMGLMGIVPGMPNVAFLVIASACAAAAYMLHKRDTKIVSRPVEDKPRPEAVAELGWNDVAVLDTIGLEVGYRLIPLVDRKQGGELMARIKGVRKKLSQDLGFLIQPVHIRDNLQLAPSAYRITLMGVPIGEGEVHGNKELAINPGQIVGKLQGIPTKEPAFGLDAVWIEPSAREHAQTLGYSVVDASTVIATHLSQLLQTHAHELLGYDEVQQLLDRLAKTSPKLVEDLVPKALPMAILVKVLQELLVEKIAVSNLRKIAETLAEHAPRSQDPAALVAAVRIALGRSIVQQINGMQTELPVITLDPKLERILQDALQPGNQSPGLEPGLAERVHRAITESAQRQEVSGEPAVLLVSPQLRPWLARFTRHSVPGLRVLSFNEVPDGKSLKMVAAVGA